MEKKLLSRKAFISLLGTASIGGFLLLWDRVVLGYSKNKVANEKRLKDHLYQGVNLYEGFYLYADSNGIKAFSTKCTHAGCNITKTAGNSMICPCHGSQFEGSTGKPVKGPSTVPLQQLRIHFDTKNSEWVIQLPG